MFRELLRKNKQLSAQECIEILKTEKRGVLSVNGDHGYPYGMPMNHWYDEISGHLYFHCGKVGHRLDALQKDDRVSFCVYDEGFLLPDEWARHVKSVIVFGKIRIIDDVDSVVTITAQLSRKFTQDETYIQAEIEQYAHQTLLLELIPEHVCGKLVKES